MARELTYKTLCESLATKCYLSEQKVDLMLQNLVLLIASELQNNSYINIKALGKFTTEMRGGTDEWFTSQNGTMYKQYVQPFMNVNFNPSKTLIDAVNGDSLTDLFKKSKFKADKPTPLEDLIEQNVVSKKNRKRGDIANNCINDIQEALNKRKEKTTPQGYGNRVTLKTINEQKRIPILCLNNNIIYPSINSACMELGIPVTTIQKRYKNGETDFDINGYRLQVVSKEEEEKGKLNNGKM